MGVLEVQLSNTLMAVRNCDFLLSVHSAVVRFFL